MKILISILLVFMTFSSYAVSPYANEFRKAIDEFNFQVTVEWDQKDLAARNQFTKTLINKIKDLRAKGMSSTDFQDVLRGMNNGTVENNDLKILLSSQKFENDEEITNFIFSKSNQLYQHGASWNGEVVTTSAFIIGAVLIALWFVLIARAINEPGTPERTCLEYSTTETCSESCSSNYDGEGYYVDNTCFTSCGYDCLKY